MSTQNLERWHVGKEIPIALVLGGFAQTVIIVAAFSWAAASFSARVDNVEKNIASLEKIVAQQAAASAPIVEKVIRLETKFDGLQQGIVEIKGMIRSSEPRSTR